MNGHTPGPWEWVQNRKNRSEATLYGKTQVVCHFGDKARGWGGDTAGEEPSPEDQALIKASPDLLEAARAALGVLLTEPARTDLDELITKLTAAIAKAEGAP